MGLPQFSLSRKLFKTLLILVLVLGSVAGSAWLFYSKLKEQKDSYKIAINYQRSEAKKNVEVKLNLANNKSDINRFSELLIVYRNLDSISETLTPYLSLAKDSDIDNLEIYVQFEHVEEEQAKLLPLLEEYINKASVQGSSFNKNTGANAVYVQLSDLLVEYAEYLKTINNELSAVVDIKSDIKFSIIDIYLTIVNETFTKFNDISGATYVKSLANVSVANSKFDFLDFYMGNFSSGTTLFVNNYSKCDKTLFANNFATNMSASLSLNGNANNDAMVYLKQVLGV